MRFCEFKSGLKTFICNEEDELLEKFDQSPLIKKSSLTEREQQLANELVRRSIIIRKNDHGQITFKRASNIQDI